MLGDLVSLYHELKMEHERSVEDCLESGHKPARISLRAHRPSISTRTLDEAVKKGSRHVMRIGATYARSKASLDLPEGDVLDLEFHRIWWQTKSVADLSFFGVICCSSMIVVGWVWFDFFSPEYLESDSFVSIWFGYVSGLMFAIVVTPWVAA